MPSSIRGIPRFRLRTVFLLVTILCCVLGFHGALLRSAREQKRVVDVIRGTDGTVVYDYESAAFDTMFNPLRNEWRLGTDSYQAYYPPVPPGPDWLINRLGVDYFCSVETVSLRRGIVLARSDLTPQMLAAIDHAIHLWHASG